MKIVARLPDHLTSLDRWPELHQTVHPGSRLLVILRTLVVLLPLLAGPAFAGTVTAHFLTLSDIPVTASGYTATGNDVNLSLGFVPATGAELMVVRNTGLGFIEGRFSNLSHGQLVGLAYNGGVYQFVANYYGGTGNDLVLTWSRTRVLAWGQSNFGQLGKMQHLRPSIPTQVDETSAVSGLTVIGISTRASHNLALFSNGTVAAWGHNAEGELGNGSNSNGLVPTTVNRDGVLSGKVLIGVAAGGSHSLALSSDGVVFAWGDNTWGQLGNGGNSGSNLPVAVDMSGAMAGKSVVAIAAGDDHSLALCSDGTVFSWGNNEQGRLGNGLTAQSSVPVAVYRQGVLAGKTVISVAAGAAHSLAICSDGTLVSWGSNSFFRLGTGSASSSSVPVAVNATGVLAGKSVSAVSANYWHNLALCSDGTLAAWGNDSYGQLGNGSALGSATPVAVTVSGELAGKTVRSIAAGYDFSLSCATDGSGAVWGNQSFLGTGDSYSNLAPGPILGLHPTKRMMQVAAGYGHAIAMVAHPASSKLASVSLSGGISVSTAGSDATEYAVSVISTATTVTVTPVPRDSSATSAVNGIAVLPGAEGPVVSLSAGVNPIEILVTAEDGTTTAYALRVVKPGDIEAVFTSATEVPRTLPAFDANGLQVDIALGFPPAPGTCLTLLENTGRDFISGEIDNLVHGQEIALTYEGKTFRFVANYYGGSGNDLVLEWARREVLSWGYNDEGQLGNGNKFDASSPMPVMTSGVLAGKTVLRVAAGDNFGMALCSDGSVVAWGGYQSPFELTAANAVPKLLDGSGVLAGKTVVAIAPAFEEFLTLCSDGTLVRWDFNGEDFIAFPVSYDGDLLGKKVVSIAASGSSFVALCLDGTIARWGSNTLPVAVDRSGLLADKEVVSISAVGALCSDGTVTLWGGGSNPPVELARNGVLTGKTVVELSSSGWHVLALCEDGAIAAWGGNWRGQLGINHTGDSAEPVLVISSGFLAGKKVKSVSAGSTHSLALCSDGTVATWGEGSAGRLGNADTADRMVPGAVNRESILGQNPIMQMAGGGTHSLAIMAKPADSKLSDLVVTSAALAPALIPDLADYSASVSAITTSVALTATTRDPLATLTINGGSALSGVPSQPVLLGVGITEIPVTVTAEDGNQSEYFVRVVRPAGIEHVYLSATDIPAEFPMFDATGLTANLSLGFRPLAGQDLTIVRNTGLAFIEGEFANLTQGQVVSLMFEGLAYKFVVNYHGGTGNDLVLEWARRSIWAWGSNGAGQLGNGGTASSPVPVPTDRTGVLAGKIPLSTSSGRNHCMVLTSEGKVVSWGANDYGQLGSGGTANSSVPLNVDTVGVLSTRKVIAIAAGQYHGLALCADGSIAAWGRNHSGQLGDGTLIDKALPVLVDGSGVLSGKTVVSIAAGEQHSIALCSDGTIATWGLNMNGQLGAAIEGGSNVPVAVERTGMLITRTVLTVSAGDSFCLALCEDGSVAGWGSASLGQLGHGGHLGGTIPVGLVRTGVLSGKTIRAISVGAYTASAWCADGTLAEWGGTSYEPALPELVTTAGVLSGKTPTGLFSGRNHKGVVCSDGTVSSWGPNSSGQLGNGTTSISSIPVRTLGLGRDVEKPAMSASAGESHSIAIVGESANSRLSEITATQGILTPRLSSGVTAYALAVPGATASTRIKCFAQDPSSVIRVNGTAVDAENWSDNIALSSGTNTVQVLVTLFDESVTSYSITIVRGADIMATYLSALDVPATFPAYDATGLTASLSLGFAPMVGSDLVVVNLTGTGSISGQFNNLVPGQILELAWGGRVYRYAVNYHGGTGNDLVLQWARRSLSSWGVNSSGQLGNNSLARSRVPVPVDQSGVLAGKTVAGISLGEQHGLAVLADGTVAAWGLNNSGQLGNNSVINSRVPVMVDHSGVLHGRFVIAVAAGTGHSAALCSDGKVVVWGLNNFGQLGNGSPVASSKVPVDLNVAGVLTGKSVVSISAGVGHTLALCSDGTIASWGHNTSGQLGNNSTASFSNVPVLVTDTGVLSGKLPKSIAAGGSHSMTLCSDGTVACWGANSSGQLGNNSQGSGLRVPVLVTTTGLLSGKTVVSIAAGSAHSLALCSDGTLAAWGYNFHGQLGNNGSALSRVPVAVSSAGVLSGQSIVAISAGLDSSMALCASGRLATWGNNNSGQLGIGSTASLSRVPVTVVDTGELYGKRITTLACGAGHCVVLSSVPDFGYIDWITGQASLTNKTETADPDSDGIPNLMEYALAGNPAAASASILPTLSADGSDFVFSFNRLASSPGDTDQFFQYSTNMSNWTDVRITAPADAGVRIGPVDGNGNQPVTVTVPKGGKLSMFGRLQVKRP